MRWRNTREASTRTSGVWLWVAVASVFAAVLLVIGVVVFTGSVREAYFSDAPIRSFEKQWYGRHLAAMKEPILAGTDHGPDYRALRVLYLPTWDHPVAVRYEGNEQGAARRIVGMSGAGGYESGDITFDQQDTLTADEFERLLWAYERAGLWSLPTSDAVKGRDGAQLVIETVVRGQHRVFVRWTPEYEAQARGLTALTRLYRATFEQAGLRLPPP